LFQNKIVVQREVAKHVPLARGVAESIASSSAINSSCLSNVLLLSAVDSRDQHTLEKLRAERQAKIDELKEKTKYYMTQQLIQVLFLPFLSFIFHLQTADSMLVNQRYDLDPAAKAAAASVLASKLGADSGLRVFVGDDSKNDATVSRSNENNIGQTTGLRQRKQSHLSNSTGWTSSPESLDTSNVYDINEESLGTPNQRSDEHFRGPAGNDGGWLARVAALLVGEDPTQCYALICSNCHMHNGKRLVTD
jgi:endoplasmic reticulum junction formation protein lunapark